MEFCYKTATVWQMVGKLIFILKILVPIIIIVLGTIDFGKAVISNDDKAVSKASINKNNNWGMYFLCSYYYKYYI